MSLISLGPTEPDLVPDGGTGSTRRHRYLAAVGVVAALLVAGGSATYLLVTGAQTTNRPPADPVLVTSDQPFVPGTADPAAVPSMAAPTPVPSGPMPSASMVADARPVPYRVAGPLCASMDLGPVQRIAGGPGMTRSNHMDHPGFGDHTCTGSFGPGGRVWLNAEVRIFPTVAAAMAGYAADRVGTDHVPGLGTAATGFFPINSGYLLLVTDGNLELRIQLGALGPKPAAPEFRQPAIDVATRTLPRLRE